MDFLASWSSEEMTEGEAGWPTAVPGAMARSAEVIARSAELLGCGGAGEVADFCVLM